MYEKSTNKKLEPVVNDYEFYDFGSVCQFSKTYMFEKGKDYVISAGDVLYAIRRSNYQTKVVGNLSDINAPGQYRCASTGDCMVYTYGMTILDGDGNEPTLNGNVYELHSGVDYLFIVEKESFITSVTVSDGFAYRMVKGEVFLYDYVGNESSVVIPDTVANRSVVGFMPEAFYNRSFVSMVLSSGIKNIDAKTFANTEVLFLGIPSSIGKITGDAFGAASKVGHIYFEGSSAAMKSIYSGSIACGIHYDRADYNAPAFTPMGEDAEFCNASGYKCGSCDKVISAGIGAKISHSFGEYKFNFDSTYDADGTQTRVCTNCGYAQTVAAPGTKLENSAERFVDIAENAWYKESVDFAVTYKIFNGTSENTFSPDVKMSRAQFVMVFANIAGVDVSDTNIESGFTDVASGMWYTGAVKWAAENNIVNGTGGGMFSPDALVTREQMCVMVVRFVNEYKSDVMLEKVESTLFADNDGISVWAKEQVYQCVAAGLIKGTGNNTFSPQNPATRAEGATLFQRFYKDYN